jgi:hypothetical protein
VGTRLLGGGLASAPRPGLIPVTEPVIAPPSGLKACAEPGEELTLGRALWLAQIYNPELAEASYEVRVRDAKTIQAGLSFPLRVFDRNQGNVLAAQSNVAKGEQGSRAAWVRVQTSLGLIL